MKFAKFNWGVKIVQCVVGMFIILEAWWLIAIVEHPNLFQKYIRQIWTEVFGREVRMDTIKAVLTSYVFLEILVPVLINTTYWIARLKEEGRSGSSLMRAILLGLGFLCASTVVAVLVIFVSTRERPNWTSSAIIASRFWSIYTINSYYASLYTPRLTDKDFVSV